MVKIIISAQHNENPTPGGAGIGISPEGMNY